MLRLTWPQFTYISCQLCRLQYQRAKNEVFFGVCASLGGNENRENLMDNAGDFFIEEPEPELTYTQEELDAAMKRADKIAAANREAAKKENRDNV